MTEIYKRTTIINYALQPGEKIIAYWPLNKESYGVKFDSTKVDHDRPFYCKVDTATTTQATLTTYFYKIPSLNVFMPYAQSSIKSGFSLYTYDSTGTVGIKDYQNLVNYTQFKVFPNPNTGDCNVEFNSDFNDQLHYKLTNILGQEVKAGNYYAHYGKNNMKLNMTDLTNGVYILNIFDNNQAVHKQKIIKQ